MDDFLKSIPEILRKLKGNASAVDWERGELDVAEIPDIFFRAEQRIGAGGLRRFFQLGGFLQGVDVMVGEAAFYGDLKFQGAQVREKGGRISDGAKGQEACAGPIRGGQGDIQARHAQDADKFCGGIENRATGVTADDGFQGRGGGLYAARDDNKVGAAQRGDRLAEAARGERAAAAEGIRGVKQDDVGVAGEFAVLEAVVEDEPIDAVAREGFAVFEAVGAYAKLDAAGKAVAEDGDFVALGEAGGSGFGI